MYNSVYPVGINHYAPQIKKKKDTNPVASEAEQQSQAPVDKDSSQQGSSFASQNVIDYSTSKVNITQIIVDFNNTITAIGAPKELEHEVRGYLGLVELQAVKDKPSKGVIKSNLKSAAIILDDYISSTLKKPSNVVAGWIDALLLQQVDYKANVELANKSIDETLNVKQEQAITSVEKIEPTVEKVVLDNENLALYLPEDSNLKRVLLQAKKYKEIQEPEKAMECFAKALNYAKKIDDKKAQAVIFIDVAELKDDANNIGDALKCFNTAKNITIELNDTTLRAKAHAGMGAIYDEVGEFNVAMEHYFNVLSLDGENENLKSQSMTLNNIGNMQISQYEPKNALGYYKEAFSLAKQIPDVDAMGTILSNTAGVYKDLGKGAKSLKYYKESIKCDTKAGKVLDCAKSFEQSGDIMIDLGKKDKAVKLYKNALKNAQQADDNELAKRMASKLLA